MEADGLTVPRRSSRRSRRSTNRSTTKSTQRARSRNTAKSNLGGGHPRYVSEIFGPSAESEIIMAAVRPKRMEEDYSTQRLHVTQEKMKQVLEHLEEEASCPSVASRVESHRFSPALAQKIANWEKVMEMQKSAHAPVYEAMERQGSTTNLAVYGADTTPSRSTTKIAPQIQTSPAQAHPRTNADIRLETSNEDARPAGIHTLKPTAQVSYEDARPAGIHTLEPIARVLYGDGRPAGVRCTIEPTAPVSCEDTRPAGVRCTVEPIAQVSREDTRPAGVRCTVEPTALVSREDTRPAGVRCTLEPTALVANRPTAHGAEHGSMYAGRLASHAAQPCVPRATQKESPPQLPTYAVSEGNSDTHTSSVKDATAREDKYKIPPQPQIGLPFSNKDTIEDISRFDECAMLKDDCAKLRSLVGRIEGTSTYTPFALDEVDGVRDAAHQALAAAAATIRKLELVLVNEVTCRTRTELALVQLHQKVARTTASFERT